jgi:hypothetical protein
VKFAWVKGQQQSQATTRNTETGIHTDTETEIRQQHASPLAYSLFNNP